MFGTGICARLVDSWIAGINLWQYCGVRVVDRLVGARTSLRRVVGMNGHPKIYGLLLDAHASRVGR